MKRIMFIRDCFLRLGCGGVVEVSAGKEAVLLDSGEVCIEFPIVGDGMKEISHEFYMDGITVLGLKFKDVDPDLYAEMLISSKKPHFEA